ncbi:hypothetical protein [Psychroflexus sp. MES1-P1E]|uniref:hypothetical protein n=1 Tax=Psychroflexus sp. MES1-P1E TaxID=2058320 RepID=UPI000C7C8132|nr:hypothetical protein [Psychroflexus sp. MES1-P1E]PKG42781.1 hypothetical protein CXF67_08455 [Psychroflexus sp. MES1-P1E]
MEKLKKCPFSGKYFKPKRSNQKFASKRNRVAFYNRRYRNRRLPLSRMNQKLFHNYSILEIALGDKEETNVEMKLIKDRGFDFTIFTQIMKHENDTYFGLYDLAFKQLDNNIIQIKRYETNTII